MEFKSSRFDIEEPNIGHFKRFKVRLEVENKPASNKQWIKFISIAASFVMLIAIGKNRFEANKGVELSEVSSKMQETQDYFSGIIEEELYKINKISTNDNSKIIKDALDQLKFLETDYIKQTLTLKENRENKTIILAMINNFQQRIIVLQNVLVQIENVNESKTTHYENNNL
ncbi:MAG: hypothetical protein V3U80_00400 [Flavobacteriaceae bacterium]